MAKARRSTTAKMPRRKHQRAKGSRKKPGGRKVAHGTAPTAAPPLELRKIRLTSCTANHNLREGQLPPHVDTHAEIKVRIDREAGHMDVLPSIRATARYDDTPAELPPASIPLFIHAEFALAFAAESLEGISDEHLNAFGLQTGFFCVWPYWREFVASTVARMGLPPLTVPLLSAAQLQEQIGDAVVKQEASPPQARRKK